MEKCMNIYIVDCFDTYTGKQNICFYGKGYTESEAIKNADIPLRYEVNNVLFEFTMDNIPEDWKNQDWFEDWMDILENGNSKNYPLEDDIEDDDYPIW